VSRPEIEVEGELWTGLVAVVDKRKQGPGHYGLVQGIQWCSSPDKVTVWRGPRIPDQVISKNELVEVTCRTVHVDKRGFYICIHDPGAERFFPCAQFEGDFSDAVKEEAEKLLNVMATEDAAEATSTADYEETYNELWQDNHIFAKATFGDSTAVNGELIFSSKDAKPPKGWENTEHGGGLVDSGDHEIDKDSLSESLAHTLTKTLQMQVDPWNVRRVLDKVYPPANRGYIIWGAGYGKTEIWISPRLMRKYEKAQEAAARTEAERARLRRAAAYRAEEARQRQEEQERQEKIKSGGFPQPQDWSPRGKLPWEK
jgi:hypothetical protein